MDQEVPKKYSFEEGEFFLINKPLDWTSFDVVNYLRKYLKRKFNLKKLKVGHAGTLDPKASGLLILCTGPFTKKIDEYQAMEKEYEGIMRLGATTPSFDTETSVDREFDTSNIRDNLIRETANQFIGYISQIPPIYSAVKIEGKKAYEYARNQENIRIKPRMIRIFEFDILEIKKKPHFDVKFRVVCSKGTYIRALVRDFGNQLKCGAYLSNLCRTRIGSYKLSEAWDLTELTSRISEKYGIQSQV